MLKRPYQIWIGYLLALSLVGAAMVWLTVNAVHVDQGRNELIIETELSSRRSQQQELVTAALWRMDSILTPLVGPEATRPYAYYQPFILQPPNSKGVSEPVQVPSPLLENPSQFVVIHFQINEESRWSSPQTPTGPDCELALLCGIPQDTISSSCVQLDTLSNRVDVNTLASRLPAKTIRQYLANEDQLAMNGFAATMPPSFVQGRNTAEFENARLNQLRGFPTTQNAGNMAYQAAQGQQDSEANDPPPNEVLPTEENQQQEGPQQRAESQRPSQQLAATDERRLGRAGIDWIQRHQAFQTYTDSTLTQQTLQISNGFGPDLRIDEGVAKWIWLDSDLILARRVSVNGSELIQGCWIDWPALKQQLLSDVADLMEGVDLMPITNDIDVQTEMSLATIPAQLVITEPERALGVKPFDAEAIRQGAKSPIRETLNIAWMSFATAAIAVALLLQGVIRLSERRGAFVSAVTHELRTPLTTFRMYAEMLAEDMITDEVKRREYLGTLRVEADRLTHLVENVLAYSRLERGQPGSRRIEISIGDFRDRVAGRLEDRATAAGMDLRVSMEKAIVDTKVLVDPSAVEQILFNLVENACKYGRSDALNEVHVEITLQPTTWRITVSDHGPGISQQDRRRLFEPFSKSVERAAETAPGVGLGLALCRRLAKALGGKLVLKDQEDQPGATFELTLPTHQGNARD